MVSCSVFEKRSHHPAQAVLKLLATCNPPASDSHVSYVYGTMLDNKTI